MQSKEKDLVPYLGGIIVDLNSVAVIKMGVVQPAAPLFNKETNHAILY